MGRLDLMAGAAVAVALLGGASEALAAEPLSWSLAATGVGRCTQLATNCADGAGVVYDGHTAYDYDFSHNAASASADPAWGIAHAWANPGEGFLAAPQLHADASGAPFHSDAYAYVYASTQGIQSYVWTGEATDIALSAFQGTLDFANSPNGYGAVSAAFGIFDHSIEVGVNEVNPLADYWYQADSSFGFLGACGDPGAIGLAETGIIDTKGAPTATLSPTCGDTTFHLEQGDTFYLWARLFVFHANEGFTDASHTFSVGLSPHAAPELVEHLSQNLVLGPPLHLGSAAPEPAVWTMMLMGFFGLGTALRRRPPLRASRTAG